MRKLKADLDRLKATLEVKNPGGAEALRFAEVNDLWRNAVGAVFGGDSADLVLDHTNSVYVMSGEQGGNLRRFDRPRSETQGAVAGKVLAVYCDDSMVRSELDNRQELLKMKFKEQGEDVEALRILPSTRDMKNRHPFREEAVELARPGAPARSFVRPARTARALTEGQLAAVHQSADQVEDPTVRRALYRALLASAARSDGDAADAAASAPGSPTVGGGPGASGGSAKGGRPSAPRR